MAVVSWLQCRTSRHEELGFMCFSTWITLIAASFWLRLCNIKNGLARAVGTPSGRCLRLATTLMTTIFIILFFFFPHPLFLLLCRDLFSYTYFFYKNMRLGMSKNKNIFKNIDSEFATINPNYLGTKISQFAIVIFLDTDIWLLC